MSSSIFTAYVSNHFLMLVELNVSTSVSLKFSREISLIIDHTESARMWSEKEYWL